MSDDKPSYNELRERLARAEAALDSLRRGDVDLVIGTGEPLVVRCKSLAEEVERLGREWQTTFDSMEDAVWILDRELRVLRSNLTAERIFKRPLAEMIGKHCWEIVHCTQEPIPECPVLRMKKSLKRETMELPVGERWLIVTIDPILDENKDLSGAVHIVSDITERKRAEAHIEHLNRVLRAIRNVNQLITHEKDRDALLRRTCEILTATRGYRSAWAALRGGDGAAQTVAESGIGEDFAPVREALQRGDWPDCCRQSAERPEGIALIHDTLRNCTTCRLAHTYRDTAALTGVLRYGGRDYGVLVVALPSSLAGEPEEQSLFRELVVDVAYALHAMELAQARKRAEEALRESRALLQAVLDNIPVRVFWKDTDLKYLGCNRAFARDAGFEDPQQLVGKDDFAMCWREQAERYRRDDQEVIRDGKPRLLIQEPQTTPLGETIHLLTSKVPLRDAKGVVIGVLGAYLDITERKRAEAEVERLSMAIEQTGEVILVTDPEGTIQYVNPAFETITGYTRREAVGQNPRLLKSGKQDEAFYRNLWETIAGGRIWRGRMVNKRKDGTLYTEDATISPVKDGNGRIISFVAVKRDITEQLRHSQEQARLREQLEQAQKMESIGRLAGGVAHDFNNMLSVILGYGDIMLRKLHPSDPLRANVEGIVKAGQRSADLTRRLLAFSRKQTLQPEVLDLNEVIRNIENMLRRLIGEDIALELSLSRELSRVMVDRGQIEQVIMNLVVNARDAMSGGGKLLIETCEVELDDARAQRHLDVTPGKYVMLAVSDTGCGMEKEVLAHIFDPFFTTKEKGKGTGLGLSMVYGIIKQSGGDIWVYSEPGQGTTFKIYLPITVDQAEARESEAAQEEYAGGGEHILVVEDEESLRRLFETMLSSSGYKVTLAANGGEALLLVEEKGLRPDLVITDVVMPGMSGSVLWERLRRKQPDLKVLYMSGYTDNAIVHHGVLDPGIPFIQKPFTTGDIAEKVRAVLRGDYRKKK